MPLPLEAEVKLSELAKESGDFSLFGIFINPQTGEMGTYSSHGVEPGKVLGFLQQSVNMMVTAAANNELEYIGGENGMAQGSTTQTAGGKIGIVN
jgi:hypothetical protein